MKEAVVVTGASGGIGRACVSRLTGLGFVVLAAVRDHAQAASFEAPVQCVRLDLSDPIRVAAAAEEIRATGLPLRGLVNNAGMSIAGALEDLSIEAIREVLEVNLFGPLQLTRYLLPELRSARGRVVNVGSGEGFLSTPLNAPYCMSKHAIEAFSASLRIELASSGVHVSVVSPGQTETGILGRARKQFEELAAETSPPYRGLIPARSRMAERLGASPDRVAEAVARAIIEERPRNRYFVGADSRGAFLLGRVAPERLRSLLYRYLLGFR
jgi:NAD(P)-dependent dehydrogenase (short-subunit alcohol dehydrogenase family)